MSVDTSQLDDLADRFAAMPKAVTQAVQGRMQSEMQALGSDIQTNRLSGQVLNVRSGRLRASITASVAASGSVINGIVGSDVPYAAILEYGGTILRSRLRSYRIVEPQRSYLRSALADRADAIQASLTDAVMQAVDP